MKKILLVLALTIATTACSDDPPAPTDVSSDVQGDGISGDASDTIGADGDSGPDGTVEAPTITFHVEGAQGAVGVGSDSITLGIEDDLDAGQLGVQVSLAVQTTNVETGRVVSVFIDGAAAAAGPISAGDEEGTANIAVTLNASEGASVRLEVTNQAGDAAAAEKTVQVVTESCTVLLLPAAQDTCLASDSDPDTEGVQTELTVQTSDPVACPTASMEVTVGDDTVSYGPTNMDDDGNAVFSITVASEGDAVEADVLVKALVEHGANADKNAEVESTYSFDNKAPQATISSPDPTVQPTLNAGDDEDPIAAGIQATISGTIDGVAQQADEAVTVSLNGEEVGTTSVVDGLFSYQVSILDSGSVTIGVSAKDDCGNEGATQIVLDAFPVAPSLVVTSPSDETVLLAKDDGDQDTPQYETEFTVQVESPNAGDTLQIQCRSKSGNEQVFFEVASAAVAEPFPEDNTWAIPVALDPGSLTNEAVCRAMIDGPNPAASPNVSLTIGLPGPSITLDEPSNEKLLNTKSAVVVAGNAVNLEGQALTIQLVGNGGVIVAEVVSEPVQNGAFNQAIDFEAVAGFTDGQYTIVVDAVDGYGNVASDLGASASATVTFDTVAPLLVAVQPAAIFITGVDDEEPGVPGYQTTVVMQLNNEAVSAGAEICLTVADENLGCKNVDEGTFQAAWTGVTLQPGPNNPLVATGKDAAGNEANPYSVTLNLDVDAPVVVITDPAETTVTVSPTINVTTSVSDNQTGEPLTAVEPTISLNGADAGITPVNNGDGTYTFESVPLVAGANELQVLVDVGAQGASPVRLVTLKAGEPSIAITWPANGQVFNLASPECAGIAADCTTDVVASVTDAEDGSTASLAIGCGGNIVEVTGVVEDGAVTFEDAVLAHGGSCLITPSITDLADQTVAGDIVTVTVDRVAPVISRFDEPFQEFLEPKHDLDPATEGIQYKLEVVVQGVEAGQVVTVDVHLQGQEPGEILESALAADAPDAVDKEVPFPVISYPDGVVELSATVADQAGNTASFDKLIFVQSVKPAAQIKSPTNPSNDCGACGDTGTCNEGVCWFKWNAAFNKKLFVTLGGFLDGSDNFRVCSNAPELAGGTPCATGGYAQVYLGDAQEGLQSVDLTDQLPEGYQTLIAELLPTAGGDWITSLDELSAADKSRRVYVDTSAPTVSDLGSSSDTLEPSLVLNAAEQVEGQPPGTFNFEFTTDEAGSAAVYVNGKVQSEFAVEAGPQETTVVLTAGGNEVYVRVTDVNGNQSPGLPAAVSFTPTVDLIGPVIQFSSPKNADWIGGSEAGSVILSVELEPGEDEADATVTLFDGGVEVGSASVSGGVATFAGALTEGAHTFSATVSDGSGNVATAVTTPETVNVDLTPPTATITSPTDGSSVSEDADAQGGFQVQIGFEAGDESTPASWELNVASCTDGGFTDCGAFGPVDSGSSDGVVASSALATVSITGAQSFFVFQLKVTDQAGNESVTNANVTVEVLDCVVSFIDLPSTWLNRSHCLPETDCDVNVRVLPSESCGDATIGLMDGALEVGSVAVSAGEEASFTLTVADGQELALQGIASVGGGEVGSTNLVNLTADTVLPVVTFVSELVDGFNTTDGANGEKYGTAQDQVGGNATLDVHAVVRVVDTNAVEGSLVSVVRTEVDNEANTAILSPSATTGADGADLKITLRDIALPNQQSTVLSVSVSDEAGNIGTAAFSADADLDKPSSPFLSVGAVDNRLPSVALSWNATGDNGGSGGPAASYEIRYSRTSINSANFDSACDVADLANSADVPTPAAPGLQETYVVAGPDPRTNDDPCKFGTDESNGTWYFGVRISDDVGNKSLLVAIAIASTNNLNLTSTTVEFSDTFATNVLSGNQSARDALTQVGTAIGDVDGDGNADFAVGSATSNAACVVYGNENAPATWTIDVKSNAAGLRHNCALPADFSQPQLAGLTGLGGSTAALGDVNADGRDDFAVSAKVGSDGVLLVYLGRNDGQNIALDSPDVIILTDKASGPPAYFSFCGVGDFLGSSAGDIGIGALGFATAFTVLSGDESWTVGGEHVVDLASPGGIDHLNISADSAVFGWGALCNGVGDVLDTPGGGGARSDLAMLRIGGNADDPVYVVPGRDVSGGENVVISINDPAAPSGEDANVMRLRQEAGNLKAGFGSTGFFGVDVTGDEVDDVVVTHRLRSAGAGGDGKSIVIFDGSTINQTGGGTYLRVEAGAKVNSSWPGTNGFILDAELSSSVNTAAAVSNWDGWSYGGAETVDLVAADGAGAGMIRVNHASDDGQYELGLFHAEDVALSGDGVGIMGSWVARGDVDGDGRPDIISGTASGSVLIVW